MRRKAFATGSNYGGEIVNLDIHLMGSFGARRAAGFGTLVVSVGPLSLRARAMKRGMDLVLACSALLFLMPLLVMTAALIRLEYGGPVFFRQHRQGYNNRLFWVYKVRLVGVKQPDHTRPRSTSRDGDHITRIGKLIRRTSIDELPQLLNVLRGVRIIAATIRVVVRDRAF